jgi:hypothetical protein
MRADFEIVSSIRGVSFLRRRSTWRGVAKPGRFTNTVALVTTLLLAAAGCDSSVSSRPSTRPQSMPAETRPSEPSIAEQADAIRGGNGDRIQIEFTPITDDDLAALRGLERLEVLMLDHPQNHVSAEGLRTLATLPNLMHLRIRGVAIDDQGAEAIGGMNRLKILNLPQSELSDTGIEKLKSLENLVQLRIGSSKLTDDGIAHLKDFASLARVHLIDVPITDRGLAVFEKMPKLESLYIDGGNVSDSAYEKLFAAQPKLHVHVDQAHHDRDPRPHEH